MVDFVRGAIAYSAPDVEMNTPLAQLPASRRTNYQFPIYQWMGWLAVAGFAIGLTAMFFISDLFGVPAPLGWASLVILFTLGALLLDRPKLLLGCMMFYFMLIPGNRFFGLLVLPLPGFIDELFFLPFIAVIVMNWIQHRQLKEATLFPVVIGLIAVLSWYVNGKPDLFTTARVTLITLKFYILWYYCRLTCTFENERQLSRWLWIYVFYVAAQFPYNILWQRGPWVRYHADYSGGIFGQGGAHLVGYLSIFALLLIMGWWISRGREASRRRRRGVVALSVVIAYNLIFMTDTKHALFVFPIVFLPFLLHSRLSNRLRIGLISAGMAFMLVAVIYLNMAMGKYRIDRVWDDAKNSPKGEMLYALTVDFPHLVRYPLLGAGPGRFGSNPAVDARVPLARRYIIPHLDERRRRGYYGRSGSVISASVVGSPQTDWFAITGEFGWLGMATCCVFWMWAVIRLVQKANSFPQNHLQSGMLLGLACSLIFLIIIAMLINAYSYPALVYPLWMLIGRVWNMKMDDPHGLPSLG